MGKYQRSVRVKEKKREQHPIWRGIGCLMIIIIPVLSYAIASLTFEYYYTAGVVPYQFLGTPRVPDWMWVSPNVASFIQAVIGQPNLWALLALTFVYTLVLGGLISLFYAFLYRRLGPPRYGPKDAEPVRSRKIKKYTR